MESDNRGMYWEPSTHILRTASHSYVMEQALRSAYVGPELGSAQLEHFRVYDYPQHPRCYLPPSPFPPPHPRDMHDAILIEIEKEHIRKDIIVSEIARRRALEAEVRRELMEMEGANRQGCDGLISLTMGFESPARLARLGTIAKQWPLEERTVPALMGTGRPSGRYETTPGRTADIRLSEVNPFLENGKEKPRTILQAKPDENISGLKRKPETPVEATESPSDDPLRKKVKIKWACEICQVNTTSERGLKDHLLGKKHKSKEAAMKVQVSGKNYCIGFCPEKATSPVQVGGTPVPKNGQNLTPPSLLNQNAGNANSGRDDKPKLQNQNSKGSKKNGKAVVKKVPKNKVLINNNKEKYKFWCEMCNVGTFSDDVMNDHKKGKKHVGRLRRSIENGGKTVTVHVKESEQICD